MTKKEKEKESLSMSKEEIRSIKDNIDVDYIEDHPEEAYNIIQRICIEADFLYTRLYCALDQIQPWSELAIAINKENKKLSKEIEELNKELSIYKNMYKENE